MENATVRMIEGARLWPRSASDEVEGTVRRLFEGALKRSLETPLGPLIEDSCIVSS